MASSKSKSFLVINAQLSYPTDAAIIARIQAGENIPLDERGLVHRNAGEIVNDIPACSIPWLLQDGAIAPSDVEPMTNDELDALATELKAAPPTKAAKKKGKDK